MEGGQIDMGETLMSKFMSRNHWLCAYTILPFLYQTPS